MREITWEDRIVRPMLESRHELGTFKDQKEGGCGRGRVGKEESGRDTFHHLKFLPATSATKTYHLHLQQIWTLSHGSVFYFCFTFSWQAKNMDKKDKRLRIMNEILNGIKVRSQEYS